MAPSVLADRREEVVTAIIYLYICPWFGLLPAGQSSCTDGQDVLHLAGNLLQPDSSSNWLLMKRQDVRPHPLLLYSTVCFPAIKDSFSCSWD